MKKRLVGAALCIVMLASILPLSAFAASVDTDGEESACTCEVACDASAMNAECAVCSVPDAPVTVCAKYSSQITDATAAQPAAENADSTAAPAATPTADVADPSTHTHTQTGNEAVTEPGEAVAAVQEIIDALPTPEQFAAMDESAQATAYDAAQAAADAYDALTPAEQQQLNSAALMALHEYFNILLAVGDKIDYTDEQIYRVTVAAYSIACTYKPYDYDKYNAKSGDTVDYTGEGKKQSILDVSSSEDHDDLHEKVVFCLSENGDYLEGVRYQSEVGKYTVYWYIEGDDTHNDYWPKNNCVNAEIKPFEIDSTDNTPVITVGNNAKSKSYDGNTKMLNEQDVSLKINIKDINIPGGDGFYFLQLRYGKDYTVTGEYDNKNVGTGKQLTITITLESNNFKFVGTGASADGKTYTYTVNDAEITQAPLTVTATDKTAYVGDAVPSLANPVLGTDYTLTGLASGDNVNVTLKYYDSTDKNEVTPDMTKPGEYIIRPTVAGAGDNDADKTLNNYRDRVELKDGKLTVAEKPVHTITATAGANGTISPVGAVKVKHGETQTFKITPASGYVVASVRVDGVNLGSLASYTFTDVNTDHTVSATFMLPWGNPQTGVDVG